MFLITNPAIDPNLGKLPGTVGGSLAIQNTLTTAISLLLVSGGVLFFFMTLWGGIEYLMAGGDKEATQKASKRISNALVGLLIVLSSFAIIYLVEAIFGINLIQFSIPTIN
jgi:hypothetical protein